MAIIWEIIQASCRMFMASALYMLFGFLIAGILYVCIRPETISRYLGKGKTRPVILASLFGIPIPLCSCGVIPVAAGLRRQGAGKGATLSFLISTPESGVDSIAVTYALMDPIMTIFRPIAGLVTALTAGFAENIFGKDIPPPLPISQNEGCSCQTSAGGCCEMPSPPTKDNNGGIAKKIIQGLRYAYVEIMGDVGGWFLLGVVIAGIITYAVPAQFFESFSDNDFSTMLFMMLAGIPMYVCATASTPIAAALILKGINPGAALVFLLVGPATNVATMSMVSGFLGKRSLIIYLSAIGLCALLMGLLLDYVYNKSGISATAIAEHTANALPPAIEISASIILAMLLAYAIGVRIFKKSNPHSHEI